MQALDLTNPMSKKYYTHLFVSMWRFASAVTLGCKIPPSDGLLIILAVCKVGTIQFRPIPRGNLPAKA